MHEKNYVKRKCNSILTVFRTFVTFTCVLCSLTVAYLCIKKGKIDFTRFTLYFLPYNFFKI